MLGNLSVKQHTAINDYHNCCVVDYFEKTNRIVQFNFIDPDFAKENKQPQSVGIWRVKPIDK